MRWRQEPPPTHAAYTGVCSCALPQAVPCQLQARTASYMSYCFLGVSRAGPASPLRQAVAPVCAAQRVSDDQMLEAALAGGGCSCGCRPVAGDARGMRLRGIHLREQRQCGRARGVTPLQHLCWHALSDVRPLQQRGVLALMFLHTSLQRKDHRLPFSPSTPGVRANL